MKVIVTLVYNVTEFVIGLCKLRDDSIKKELCMS